MRLLLAFVSRSRGAGEPEGTLKISRKLLPAALRCSEMETGAFAGDAGNGERMGRLAWVTAPRGLDRHGGRRSPQSPARAGHPKSLPSGWGLPGPAGHSGGPGHLCCGSSQGVWAGAGGRAHSGENCGWSGSCRNWGEEAEIVFPRPGRAGPRRPHPGWGGWWASLPFNLSPGDKRHRGEEWSRVL